MRKVVVDSKCGNQENRTDLHCLYSLTFYGIHIYILNLRYLLKKLCRLKAGRNRKKKERPDKRASMRTISEAIPNEITSDRPLPHSNLRCAEQMCRTLNLVTPQLLRSSTSFQNPSGQSPAIRDPLCNIPPIIRHTPSLKTLDAYAFS